MLTFTRVWGKWWDGSRSLKLHSLLEVIEDQERPTDRRAHLPATCPSVRGTVTQQGASLLCRKQWLTFPSDRHAPSRALLQPTRCYRQEKDS